MEHISFLFLFILSNIFSSLYNFIFFYVLIQLYHFSGKKTRIRITLKFKIVLFEFKIHFLFTNWTSLVSIKFVQISNYYKLLLNATLVKFGYRETYIIRLHSFLLLTIHSSDTYDLKRSMLKCYKKIKNKIKWVDNLHKVWRYS